MYMKSFLSQNFVCKKVSYYKTHFRPHLCYCQHGSGFKVKFIYKYFLCILPEPYLNIAFRISHYIILNTPIETVVCFSLTELA
jgi:hypothetical protein